MTFRPRFSLRTLCVFLLLVTSGVGLWWHWEPWYCVRSVNEHTGPVYRAQFSRDCMRVLTHSEGEEPLARVWDGETGQMLAAMERSACYTDCAAAFSHDGTRLLTAGLDRTARVLEIPGGRQIAGAPLGGQRPWGLAFSSAGPRALTRTRDNTLCLLDGANGDEVATLEGHADLICRIALSDNGDRLLTADQRNGVRVWDCTGGRCLAVMEDNCGSIALSPDGALALTSRWDGTATVWGTDQGTALAVLKGHRKLVKVVAWPSDGKRVLTYDCGNVVRLWEIATGECLAEARIARMVRSVGSFSSDGERVATATFVGPCHVWSISTGEHLAVLDPKLDEGATRHSTDALWGDCSFSADGKRLVSVDCSGFIHIYRRRRPEWWWGVFYLWEFWLTVVFAGVFVWSVVRDGRALA